MMKEKIAFYVMNAKGYYVLNEFISTFGTKNIEYIVSSVDSNIKKDFFYDIQLLAKEEKIKFFSRTELLENTEKVFNGYKFVIGWRWLIKNEFNLIVFHDSLLPKYRGFAPLVNCLINGEKKGGVTALFANGLYDSGDIISQRFFQIKYPLKIDGAIDIIKPLYFSLIEDIYTKLLNNIELDSKKQDDIKSSYSLWLDDKDYFIDWKWSSKRIKRFVDSVGFPYDNAKSYLNGNIVKFFDVTIIKDIKVEHRERHIGKVVFIDNGVPVIVCKKGLLGLIKITDESDSDLFINFRSKFI